MSCYNASCADVARGHRSSRPTNQYSCCSCRQQHQFYGVRCPPSPRGRRWRVAVACVAFLVVLLLFVSSRLVLMLSFVPPPVYAVFGVDRHRSVMRLLESDVRVTPLPASNLERPSTADVGNEDGDRTADAVAIFVILDDADLAPAVDWRNDRNSSLGFDCYGSYRYHIYLIAPAGDSSNDDAMDQSSTATTQASPGPRSELQKAAERLRQRCLVSSPVSLHVWNVRIGRNIRQELPQSNLDDLVPSTELPPTVPVSVIADIIMEAYVDNVTWYDVVALSRTAVDFRSSRSTSASKSAEGLPSPFYVDFRQTLNRTHVEIFGDAWPRELRSFRQVSDYLTYTRSTTGSAADVLLPLELRQIFDARRLDLDRYMKALEATHDGCLRCPLRRAPTRAEEYKVISMSLYGNDPRYTIGAIRNAQLLPVIFPRWLLRFYVLDPTSTPPPLSDDQLKPVLHQVLDRLVELGAEIHYVDVAKTGVRSPMVWRFLVADDSAVDVFISRDADSRLTPRDYAAVDDWLSRRSNGDGAPPPPFHCIRDHPSHADFAANGGMWGARRAQLVSLLGGRTFAEMLAPFGSAYMDDMRFIDVGVWNVLVGSAQPADVGEEVAQTSMVLCHDSVSCERWPGAVAFGVPRRGSEHVGQVFDGRSVGRQSDIDSLLAAERNKNCEPERV